MIWQKNEQIAYEWFLYNYDNHATLYGGSDSTISDIYSPKFGGYIEIKTIMPSAFGGQFTINTAKYDVCKEVMNGKMTRDNAILFLTEHYKEKNVVGFIVVNEELNFYNYEDFIKNFEFDWQKRGKKSGTSSVPKKYWTILEKIIPSDLEVIDEKLYVKDMTLIGEYFWDGNNQFFISKISKGEVRKCSHTKNETWLVTITKK